MTKITKLGLSAMVALAMMLTTSVGVVAQEQVKASSDNVEVKESLSVKPQAIIKNGKVSSKVLLAPVWFIYTSGDHDSPGSYTPSNLNDGTAASYCQNGSEELCAIKVAPESEDEDALPDSDALDDMQTEINSALAGNPSSIVKLRDEEP